MKIEESAFNVLLEFPEGKEPNLCFYSGIKSGDKYFPVSITGAGKLPFEQGVLRYTVFSSGAVIQTFLLWIGVPPARVELYASAVLSVQLLTMAFCAFTADKFRKIKRIISVCFFIFPAIFVVLLIVSLGTLGSIDLSYGIILFGSILTNLALGIYNILTYKLPYSVFRIESYGRISGVIGIIANAATVGVSFLMSFLVSVLDYRIVMSAVFTVGAILWTICAVLSSCYRTVNGDNTDSADGESKERVTDLFKYPLFFKTIIPTVLRGVAVGILGLIVSIGTRDGILDTKTATYITVISCAGAAAGYFLFLFLERKIKHGLIIILFGVSVFILSPFITLSKSVPVLFILYFLAYSSITAMGMTHPVLVFESVEYRKIGRYTAWRMLFMTLGQALPGFFVNAIYPFIGSVGIMAICAVSCALSSVWLGIVLKPQQGEKLAPQDGNPS